MLQDHLEDFVQSLDLLDVLLEKEGLEEDQDHQEVAEVEDLLLLIIREGLQLLVRLPQ